MRKDVKVGLASGGVLLAVVVVYATSLNKQPTTAGTKSPLMVSGAAKETATKRPAGTVTIASDNEPARPIAPVATDTAVAAAPSEPDWSRLLETGAPPALMTHTPTPGQPSKPYDSARSVDVFADTTSINTPKTSTPPIVGSETAAATPAVAPADAGVTTPTPTLAATSFNAAPVNANLTRPTAPVSNTAAATGSGAMKTYVVKSGESFYTIARDLYGNSHFYPHISRANPDIDPSKIRPGMTINVPDASAVKPTVPVVNPTGTSAAVATATTAKPAVAPAPLAADEYRVGNNDNLYRIAAKLYGSPAKMQEIYDLNKATIGEDPAKLKVGTVLKLPAGAKKTQ